MSPDDFAGADCGELFPVEINITGPDGELVERITYEPVPLPDGWIPGVVDEEPLS